MTALNWGSADRVPRAVKLVLADRDDQGIARVVLVGGNLPLERFLVGAFEVAQALGPGLADAGVPVFLLDDVGPALGLDVGQRQLFAQDLGEVVHRQLDLEDVMARRFAGPLARVAVAGAADRRAHITRSLSHAAPVLGPVAELGQLDLRQGDGDVLSPRLADHLAVRDVLAQVRLDLAADDLLEPIGVSIYFSHHGFTAPAVACLRSPFSPRPPGPRVPDRKSSRELVSPHASRPGRPSPQGGSRRYRHRGFREQQRRPRRPRPGRIDDPTASQMEKIRLVPVGSDQDQRRSQHSKGRTRSRRIRDDPVPRSSTARRVRYSKF